MSLTIPDQVPLLFHAGETVKFRRAFGDFPRTQGWAYTIYLNGPTNILNKAGVADGDTDGFLITLLPADLAVAPGLYRYIERVTNSSTGEVYTADDGTIQIEFDLATAPAGAMLSFAEKTLNIIEAAIGGRLTSDLQSYQIAGRAVVKIPINELLRLRGYFKSMIQRKALPGTIGDPVRVDFTDEANNADFPATWVDVTGLTGAGQ